MKTFRAPITALAVLSSLLLCSSCSSCRRDAGPTDSTQSGKPGGQLGAADLRGLPGTVFDVTYTANTVQVSEEVTAKTLQSVSSDGIVYVFDPSDPLVASLAPGKVMFLRNVSIRRVNAVAPVDGRVAVITERASLTDFIKDGTIQFRVPIHFDEQASLSPIDRPWDRFARALQGWITPEAVYASEGGETSGSENGWKFKSQVKRSPDRLAFRIFADYTNELLTVNLTGDGVLKNFEAVAAMQIRGGAMKQFDYSTANLDGEMKVDWGVVKGGGGKVEESRLKLPASFTTPLPIGGIPFVLEISENLIFKPGFGGNKDVGRGSFKVTYNGTEGIKVTNGTATADAKMSAQPTLGDTQTSSLAPHGVVIGVAAPKIALKLGTESGFEVLHKFVPSGYADRVAEKLGETLLGKKAVDKAKDLFKTEGSASVQVITLFTFAGSGPLSIVPCKLSHLKIMGKAGAELTLLGRSVPNAPEVVLFEKAIALRTPDINACGEK